MRAVKLLAGPKYIHVMAERDIVFHMWMLYDRTFGEFMLMFDSIHDVVGEQDDPQYEDMCTFIERMAHYVSTREGNTR